MNMLAAFPKLTDDERARLIGAGQTVKFSSGACIVREGDHVDSLLVIKSGNLRVTRTYLDELTAEFAGPLGPGEVVGELSFWDGKGASASLIADGDTEMLSIPRAEVDRLLAADDGFRARFFESLFLDLARKLRSTNQRVLPVPP